MTYVFGGTLNLALSIYLSKSLCDMGLIFLTRQSLLVKESP